MDNILWCDFETRSKADLPLVGTYVYIEDEAFQPLLLSYAFDDDEFQVHDFLHDDNALPLEVVKHLMTGGILGSHSPFDFLIMRMLLERDHRYTLTPDQHLDTAVLCAEYGIPQSLKNAGEFLGCPEKKDPVGRIAINKFCKPKKIKRGSTETRFIDPDEDQELWDQFVLYCRVDGELMRDVFHRIPRLSAAENELRMMDRRIQDRGVRIDQEACHDLYAAGEAAKVRLNELIVEETGGQVETVGQVAKISAYCGTTSAGEPALTAALAAGILDPSQAMVARLRLAGARSSAAKIPKMLHSLNADGRSRGTLVFHGTVTGRWAGRLWQPHNLPRDAFDPDDMESCVEASRQGFRTFVDNYPDPMKAISKCIRGLIVPGKGKELIIADYSQIEARLVVWYAGQWDAVNAFAEGKDVYKQMASSVFQVPVHQINGAQRFIGKTLILGSSYGLGWAGLQCSLQAQAGIQASDEEAKHYTYSYRRAFDRVASWWQELTSALWCAWGGQEGLDQNGEYSLRSRNVHFGREVQEDGTITVYIRLPTGKYQWFHDVRRFEEEPPWGGEPQPVLKARNPRGAGHYALTHSILAENICSATAREVLARAMLRLESKGYDPILSVHDEVICEVPRGYGTDDEIEDIMCQRPTWGKTIPLAIEMQRSRRYTK